MGRHYEDPLEFLLDGVAESLSDGRCTDLSPSPGLRQLWEKWGELVRTVLDEFWLNPANNAFIAVELDGIGGVYQTIEHVDYDVFQTIIGAGVGVDDGDWDKFFGDGQPSWSSAKTKQALRAFVALLKTRLTKAAYAFEMAMHDEASEQCRAGRGIKIDTSDDDFELNGVDDPNTLSVDLSDDGLVVRKHHDGWSVVRHGVRNGYDVEVENTFVHSTYAQNIGQAALVGAKKLRFPSEDLRRLQDLLHSAARDAGRNVAPRRRGVKIDTSIEGLGTPKGRPFSRR